MTARFNNVTSPLCFYSAVCIGKYAFFFICLTSFTNTISHRSNILEGFVTDAMERAAISIPLGTGRIDLSGHFTQASALCDSGSIHIWVYVYKRAIYSCSIARRSLSHPMSLQLLRPLHSFWMVNTSSFNYDVYTHRTYIQ